MSSGQFYQDLDHSSFDYELHAVEGIPNALFRGPAIDTSRPYLACIGAAQAFGRFCHRPFSALLRERLGIQVLNLGVGGAGPRQFDTPEYLQRLNGAQLVIVQVLSGRSEGNSLFDNSATGSLLGTRLSDGKTMRFEDFLRDIVETGDLNLIRRVVTETRDNYVRSTISLLDHIRPPKVLFWFSDRSPDYQDHIFSGRASHPIVRKVLSWLSGRSAPPRKNLPSYWKILGSFPHLVNQHMVERLRTHSDAYVECVSKAGIPQTLWKADQEIDGAKLEDGMLVNRYYPSPEMHAEAAELLAPVCSRYLSGPSGTRR